MINILFCCIVLLVLSFQISVAQWTKIANLPSTEFSSFASKDSVLYVATLSNILYKSTNFGEDWVPIEIEGNNVVIEKIEIIDSILYIGTKNTGIFQSKDEGVSFVKSLNIDYPVTDFVKRGNSHYTSSLGRGVFRYSIVFNGFVDFYNMTIPMNVAGSVTNILSIKDYLFIASGGNGVFHRFSTIDNGWREGYYYGSLAPGLQINDAINFTDTIYVVNGNRVIVSTNDGLTWQDDKVGSRNGVDRLIYEGKKDLYIITSDYNPGTWIQKREKYSPIGTNWSSDDDYIPNFYCFDIIEYNNRIYLASENGVYYKSIVTSVSPKEQIENENNFQVNIVSDILKIHSSKDIDHVTIYNTIGQIVYHKSLHSTSSSLKTNLPSGVYGMKIVFTDGSFSINTILIE